MTPLDFWLLGIWQAWALDRIGGEKLAGYNAGMAYVNATDHLPDVRADGSPGPGGWPGFTRIARLAEAQIGRWPRGS